MINQIQQRQNTSTSFRTPVDLPSRQITGYEKYQSTITHGAGKRIGASILSFISFPFRFVGKVLYFFGTILRKALFCCCKFPPNDQHLNWSETKETFKAIHTAAITSKDGQHFTTRQKKFDVAFSELSLAARKRFKEHIGYVLSSKKNKADQEIWYNNNKSHIEFDDYFKNINQPALAKAVQNFNKELQEKG